MIQIMKIEKQRIPKPQPSTLLWKHNKQSTCSNTLKGMLGEGDMVWKYSVFALFVFHIIRFSMVGALAFLFFWIHDTFGGVHWAKLWNSSWKHQQNTHMHIFKHTQGNGGGGGHGLKVLLCFFCHTVFDGCGFGILGFLLFSLYIWR